MAGIAKEAGVSSGLVHYHFATKEQLFAEVLSYSHGLPRPHRAGPAAGAGVQPAQRLSAFLDRCLPSDERLTHDWLIWQELDLLCLRAARARQGRRRPLRGPLRLRRRDHHRRHRGGRLRPPCRRPGSGRGRGRAVRRPRRPRPGAPPRPALEQARAGRARRRPDGRPRRPAPPPDAPSRRPVHDPSGPPSPVAPCSRGAWRWADGGLGAATGCAYFPSETKAKVKLPAVGQGEDRRRPHLLQLGRLPRPERVQGLRAGVRRQGHPVQLRLDGGDVRQAPGRQPVRHRLPDRQVGAEAARRGQGPRRSTTTSSPTPTRSSTPAPTSTTRGTTTSPPSRSPSPSTRPGSAGAPTRSTR